jgi:DNA-binding protein H-NS
LDRRIQEKQKAQRASVIEQIVNVVKEYDVPIEELVEALGGLKLRRKGTKAKAKYRDPATGTTWSGRGKEPAWIKGMVDRSPFEIH